MTLLNTGCSSLYHIRFCCLEAWKKQTTKKTATAHCRGDAVELLMPTDHVLAVRGGASSALLRAAEGDLHLLHLLLEDLLLLGQLLVAAQRETRRQVNAPPGSSEEVGGWVWKRLRVWLTPWPGCGAPRSPRPASGCCPPSPPPPASACAPLPGASGCSSEGRRRSTPTPTSHWGGGRERRRPSAQWTIFQSRLHLRRTFECFRRH